MKYETFSEAKRLQRNIDEFENYKSSTGATMIYRANDPKNTIMINRAEGFGGQIEQLIDSELIKLREQFKNL